MATHLKTIERELTETELAELGKQQAHLLYDVEQQEAEAKSSAALYKSNISDMKKQIREITKQINRRVDKRDVECDILINTPEAGKKTFVDVHTGAHVAVEDMEESEKQCNLFAVGERPEDAPADEVQTPTTDELENMFSGDGEPGIIEDPEEDEQASS